MKPLSKAQALAKSKTAQRSLNSAEARATELAQVRDQAVFSAQQAGASYAEIQAVTDLSTARVTQILRKVRNNLFDTD